MRGDHGIGSMVQAMMMDGLGVGNPPETWPKNVIQV